MSEMVKRVMDAIRLAEISHVGGMTLENMARAAIEAMREPTEAMLKYSGEESYGIGGEGDAHSDVWRWMISAALK